MECARVLSKLRFPATIIFLTVAGEEQGLNGSQHFAKMAKEQGWNIEAALNNDIVGGNKGPEQDFAVVRVFSEGVPVAADEKQLRQIRGLGGESDSHSRELARYVAEVGRTYRTEVKPLLIFRLDRYLRGGDHYSFNEQGFAAVRFTEYREDYNRQHQNIRTENGVEYGDLPKFVNFDYVANVTRVNAATLASLASGPSPPAMVRLDTHELQNDSTLLWEGSRGANSYEVVWRATSSPEWEHAQNVGNVMRLQTGGVWLNAYTSTLGRYLEIRRAVFPVSVKTAIAAMGRSSAACAIDSQIASATDKCWRCRRRR